MSYLLYPKVFEDYARHLQQYSDTSGLSTPVFFYGLEPGEEITIDIEPGKTLIIKFLTVGDLHPDGRRTVFFELNGQPRDVTITDRAAQPETKQSLKAEPGNPNQIGASMPGMVVSVVAKPGQWVKKGEALLSLEAMKMQATVVAERDAKIEEVFVKPGSQVETGDLLITIQ